MCVYWFESGGVGFFPKERGTDSVFQGRGGSGELHGSRSFLSFPSADSPSLVTAYPFIFCTLPLPSSKTGEYLHLLKSTGGVLGGNHRKSD